MAGPIFRLRWLGTGYWQRHWRQYSSTSPLLWHCWHQAHLWAGTQNWAHRAIGMGSGCADAAWPHGAVRRRFNIDAPNHCWCRLARPGHCADALGDPQAVNITGLRIAMYTDNGSCRRRLKRPPPCAAATALAEAGASVEEDRPAVLERTADLANNLSGADGRSWVRRLLRQAGRRFTPCCASALTR